MLSEAEIRDMEAERAQYPHKYAAGLATLQVIQRHRRWVSDDSLREVAEYLGVTVEDLDGVATFYTNIFRQPVGRHVIRLCDSVSCWILGSERVAQMIFERIGIRPGETSADGKFTLLPSACLGACDHAPAMLIDNDLLLDVSEQNIASLLARYE
jgi:NADH-quinone oxidoreductase subunit E